jgi:TorA maturation chaperone TorD
LSARKQVQFESLPLALQKQQSIYSFLQGIYEKELPKSVIADLPQKMKPLLAVAELLSSAESKQAVEELARFTYAIPSQNLDTMETTLAADYARLFLSINKVPPHPSESTYREGVMMQYYRDEVLKTYWKFGVTAKKEFTEPEDHIATELSFMAYLCQQAINALNSGNKKDARKYLRAQRDFLSLHLLKWAPALVRDIMDSGRTPFYKGIAALTAEYLEMSLAATGGMLKQLKG